VVKVLETVTAERGLPRTIRVDNGPEFISKPLDWWAYFNGVKLDFSRPEKPTENAFIETFSGKFRQECLNQHWFLLLEDGQEVIAAWREDYNQYRPHSALGDRSPVEFANFSGGLAPRESLVSLAFQVDQAWGQGQSLVSPAFPIDQTWGQGQSPSPRSSATRRCRRSSTIKTDRGNPR
jgi:putative transposase